MIVKIVIIISDNSDDSDKLHHKEQRETLPTRKSFTLPNLMCTTAQVKFGDLILDSLQRKYQSDKTMTY